MSPRLRAGAVLVVGMLTAARVAFAEPDADATKGDPKIVGNEDTDVKAMPIATIKPHQYTLAECLTLAERNHPYIWMARARLANYHAQLDEARWTPFSYWSSRVTAGVIPPLSGTPFYNQTPRSLLSEGIGDKYEPFFQFSFGGTIPLYTFGKIENIKKSAEAQVRVGEWDIEKQRQQVRMDVRRAYFGLMLAHDAYYIADDVMAKLQRSLDNVIKKLEAGDTSVEEADRLRLEIYKDELIARVGEAKRGEQQAFAALRFLTGVQTAFEITDEPLKKPEVPLGPVVRYLAAARLFRADVNMARAAVGARKAYVDFQRSNLFPNIGLGMQFGYAIAPSATPQNTAWIGDPWNGGPSAGAAIGIDFGLDVLPKQARVAQAEAQLEEARAQERLALGGIAVEVETSYAYAVEAKGREETWDRAEHRAKRWISSVQDAIDLGTKDERFLIEPLRVYVFARANHSLALMDYNVALSDLARTSGWDAAAPTD